LGIGEMYISHVIKYL